jgi:membrane dipeptidase
MKIFDLHQDLMLHMLAREKYKQTEQTSWTMLESSPVDLVVATAFPDPESGNQQDPAVSALITADIDRYRDFLQKNKTNWQLVQTAADIMSEKKKVLLHIEGLNTFVGTPTDWQQLVSWVDLGVRSMGMHWNIDNALGGGTNSPTQPLTPLGAEVLRWIESHNLVLDLAHAGRQTFFDIAKISQRPLYVSHGNADALCSSVRNYTDEQLRLVAATDGVIGVFFAQTFVTGRTVAGTIDNLIAHIDYLKALIGIRHIAFGSDFGGIVTGSLAHLSSVADFPLLVHALAQRGYTDHEIEAVCFRNAKRVLQAHLES